MEGVSYNWQVTGGSIVQYSYPVGITVEWHDAGTALVSAIPNNVCGAGPDREQSIHVTAIPIVNAGNDTTINYGQSMTLNGCCEAGEYIWTPSVYLSNDHIAHPVASPLEPMTYTLQIVTGRNCVGSDDITIQVIQNIFIPNLITPNGDHENDRFMIPGLCNNSQLLIYDRWGAVIYKSDNYKNTWDAANHSAGVYYYSLQESCSDKEYHGWVQVIK